jgi:cell division protein FtsI (penicillin-binding protein 3)
MLPPARRANTLRRMRVALAGGVVVLMLFAGRLFQLQGVDSSALAAKALAARSTHEVLPAHRGDILDTTGAVLATTIELRNITVDQTLVPAYNQDEPDLPGSQKGVAGAAAALAPVVGQSVRQVTKELSGRKRFGYVVKGVPPETWTKVSALKIPGLLSEQASRRTYPNGQVGAAVIGFTGSDGTPLSGIELADNGLLAGKDGKLTYERGSGGQEIATGMQTETDPVDGRDVQLTIDRDLQYEAQQALSAQVKKTGALSGQLVVLNVRTGQVLALASAPTFDANSPGTAKSADLGDAALSTVFEPGSTSKVITAAAALQTGKATPATKLTIPNSIQRAGSTFHDAENHGTEKLTLAGVLAKSSNIGAIEVGEKLSPSTMYDFMTKFGLGSRTGIGLPESAGILAPPSQWINSNRYTVLFGQGLSVTALQSASVFATVANNGVRITPTIVKAAGDGDGRLTARPEGRQTRVISASVAKKLRLMLESVVGSDGTAALAEVPGYRVAGKTGTADYYDPKLGRYSGYTGSFVGMAPADNPQLVVAVYLQKPKKGYYGGTVAAPVFQQVMTYALAHEKIAPTGTKAPKVPLEWH